jgi:hypothetical protein
MAGWNSPGRMQHPCHINNHRGSLPISTISHQENISFATKSRKTEDITKLEREFDELYDKALILSRDPDNSDYEEIKKELDSNIEERIRLIRG